MRHTSHCGVVITLLVGALLPACGQNTFLASGNASAQRLVKVASGDSIVYRFSGGYDGYSPVSALTYLNGVFYGTTFEGGASGAGTVFSVTPQGQEEIVHSFSGPDGSAPEAGLLNESGTLYGTTVSGGANGRGCVFTITPSGTQTVVYSFGNTQEDGSAPASDLIDVSGTLYGTTVGGGANGDGTVYALSKSGAEKVIYSFKGGKDGQSPRSGLVAANGTLYGTTQGQLFLGPHWGTVFSLTPSGIETVLYNFKGAPDGANPYAGLVYVSGTLYGTTQYGGTSGWGTVFSVSTSSKESVMHSFIGFKDGEYPMSPLIDLDGTLYGTTRSGGANKHCVYGCGTVYSVSTAGKEKVLYTFRDNPDGYEPEAALTTEGTASTLYGTTLSGGYGYGTIFSISP